MSIEIRLIRANQEGSTLYVEPAYSFPWKLRVFGEGLNGDEFVGDSLFDALTALRLHFEAQGSRLICAGARRNVYPSGMARSMGSARKAYMMEIGYPATVLVDIFDRADPEEVGTVNEQLQFRQLWIASLREKL